MRNLLGAEYATCIDDCKLHNGIYRIFNTHCCNLHIFQMIASKKPLINFGRVVSGFLIACN